MNPGIPTCHSPYRIYQYHRGRPQDRAGLALDLRPEARRAQKFACLMLGEVADALFLANQRMEPAKLKATGHDLRYSQLEIALRHLLKKQPGAFKQLDSSIISV